MAKSSVIGRIMCTCNKLPHFHSSSDPSTINEHFNYHLNMYLCVHCKCCWCAPVSSTRYTFFRSKTPTTLVHPHLFSRKKTCSLINPHGFRSANKFEYNTSNGREEEKKNRHRPVFFAYLPFYYYYYYDFISSFFFLFRYSI